ncbi:hypothetical protein GCM10018775_79990 [Streptomyces umbrinus]|nr:hypothetical protein GCM10018775_79990 [Streptomyces umbrinus]
MAVTSDFVIGQLGPGVVTEEMRRLVVMSVLGSESSSFSLLRRNIWTFDLIFSISSFGPSPKGVTHWSFGCVGAGVRDGYAEEVVENLPPCPKCSCEYIYSG